MPPNKFYMIPFTSPLTHPPKTKPLFSILRSVYTFAADARSVGVEFNILLTPYCVGPGFGGVKTLRHDCFSVCRGWLHCV